MVDNLIINSNKDFSKLKLEQIISPETINKRVVEIGDMISNTYKNEIPIIIGVLNGAFVFMSDLIRTISIQFEIDFIKISSYGNKTISSEKIKLINDISVEINNRHVIIIEDIVDTGISIKFLKDRMEKEDPKSIKFATCLYKTNNVSKDIKIDWIGFNIEDYFIAGYGLDLKQCYRGLPGIYKLTKENN